MSPFRKNPRKRRIKWTGDSAPPHAPPGTLTVDPAALKPSIRIIAYGPDAFVDHHIDDPRQISECLHRYPVTWVNVDGLGDINTLKIIGEIFGVHRLALEDVAHVRQRPKVDEYEHHLYIVARMIDRVDGRLATDQLSMFLGKDYVLTFQQRPGDCLDAIRLYAKEKRGRLRDAGADYLAYAILDAVVDEYFPLLEALGDRLENLEDNVLIRPETTLARQVHETKRELLILRRAVWPLREAISSLQRGTSPLISNETRIYFRDCYDHTIQVLDLIEIYRELCSGLIEMYMTAVSHRMNEIIKVLTIISTLFIPLTFIVGLYGMNFEFMPELHKRWGYPLILIVMAIVTLCMLVYFWRKGWIGPANSAAEHQDGGEHEPS